MTNYTQNTKSSYRSVFKATSLFGGVQIYTILIEIIKSKIVAVLLGPTGVGIQSLFITGTKMIQNLSSCGLSTSAVQSISAANASGDQGIINRVVTALRKLVWLTGLLGMFLVICLSPILSETSFGDSAHIWGFIAISVILLLNQINAGQKVILQGTRKYKYLAKCSTIGVTMGLLICIPLFYFWGIEAIVPTIIIGAVVSLILSTFYSRKVPVKNVSISMRDTFSLGKSMLVMGIAMSVTQFLAFASTYVLLSFIRSQGGVEEVGIYNAGAMLMTQYTGLVFQALGTDFYPRLAEVNKDNKRCAEIMNQQGELGLLLLGPLMVALMIYIPIGILILYSDAFLAIDEYVVWCSISVILQMASWSISYVFIAKAESRLFTINEVISCIYGLILNVIGYYVGGVTGIGISFVVKYIVYTAQVFIIAHMRYNFQFTRGFLRLFTIQLLFCGMALLVAFTLPQSWRFIIGAFLLLLVGVCSYKGLNNRMDISAFIKNRRKKAE